MKLKEKLVNNEIVIHCDTFEKAGQLFEILNSWNVGWINGSSLYYCKDLLWNKEACYRLGISPNGTYIGLWRSIIDFCEAYNYEIWTFEQFIEEYNKEIEMNKKENFDTKELKNALQEIFGKDLKFDIVNLNDIVENTKSATKELCTNIGVDSLLKSIVETHVKQNNTEETNKNNNDEYFFDELEKARKSILEAKLLDKKTILINKEREKLQGVILEYCHRKDWQSTIKFTLSKEIVDSNLKDEFLKSVCEEFRLELVENETAEIQNVVFELRTNL